jgi:hypothetical protein
MGWLRNWLRKWLGIESDAETLTQLCLGLERTALARTVDVDGQLSDIERRLEQHRIGAAGLEKQLADLRRILTERKRTESPQQLNVPDFRRVLEESYTNGVNTAEVVNG